MGYKDIKAGKYLAKAVQGAFGKSKNKGTPQVGIEFTFKTPEGTQETLWWIGFLTEKARERAFDTLSLIKFNGDPDFGPGSFDPEAEVELVIEMEEHEGKSRPKIQWVNEPGGSKFSDLPVTEVKTMITSLGVDLKQEMKARAMAKPAAAPTAKKTEGNPPF